MFIAGTILINLSVLGVSLSLSGGTNPDWLVVLLFAVAGVACICWDAYREDLRLERDDASYKARCLRKQEAALCACVFTSWFGGFFLGQALAVNDEEILLALGIWIAVSVALSVWYRKVAKEFQKAL